MKKIYRTIGDVLRSPWTGIQPDVRSETTDRVLRSSKSEDSIYTDLRSGDDELIQTEDAAAKKMVDANTAKNHDVVSALVAQAVRVSAEKAEEVQNIIATWGDDPADLKKTEANAALLETVRKSTILKDVAKYLGRFREIFAQGKRNGYAYGRGEKYSLELGNDLSRAITPELAMLASPLTTPLFLRKYQQRQIKQYQRREPIYKGRGDIICCLDESGSTKGDPAAWGKAVALTMLEIAADGKRNFALIHFSGTDCKIVQVFRPGEYNVEDKMRAAETFLDGGTNFETPINAALELMGAILRRPMLCLLPTVSIAFFSKVITNIVPRSLPPLLRDGSKVNTSQHMSCYHLPQNSMVMLEQIRTLDRTRLHRYLGCVSSEKMSELDTALGISIELSDTVERT